MEDLADLIKSGKSLCAIAKELNVQPSTLRRRAIKLGLYKPKISGIVDGKVECKKCKKIRLVEDFPELYLDARHICIDCTQYQRHQAQIGKLGVTANGYSELLIKQDGKCGICKTTVGHVNKKGTVCRLAVDHDHQTGLIRGLLCMKCNRGLGLLERHLEAALDYLRNAK